MKKTLLFQILIILFTGFSSGFAQVIYTDVVPDAVLNQLTIGDETYNLDMNNDGVTDYQIINSYSLVGDTVYSKTIVLPDSGNEVAVDVNKYPLALLQDTLIGNNLTFSSNIQGPLKQIISVSGSNPNFLGNWVDGFNRFMGVHFHDNGSMKYGWVEMLMDNIQLTVSTTIMAYAYDNSGAAIVAYDSSAAIGISGVIAYHAPSVWVSGNSVIIKSNQENGAPMIISVTDVEGRLLRSAEENHQLTIDLTSQPSGVLMITVKQGSLTVTRKVFIQ